LGSSRAPALSQPMLSVPLPPLSVCESTGFGRAVFVFGVRMEAIASNSTLGQPNLNVS